jgi:hypothetical protein
MATQPGLNVFVGIRYLPNERLCAVYRWKYNGVDLSLKQTTDPGGHRLKYEAHHLVFGHGISFLTSRLTRENGPADPEPAEEDKICREARDLRQG